MKYRLVNDGIKPFPYHIEQFIGDEWYYVSETVARTAYGSRKKLDRKLKKPTPEKSIIEEWEV